MSLLLSDVDKQQTIDRYSLRYQKFGYSPKTLGWDKGKQDLRFEILTSQYDFSGKSVLDVGCGFGDLNKTLLCKYSNNYYYLGIDLVPALIDEAKKRYEDDNINFQIGDFLGMNFNKSFDYVVASGIFNHRLNDNNNYEFIDAAIEKSLSLANDGVAFDFLSDKVDYTLDHAFHSAPEQILSIAYKYSRNVVLRNDYMPFEFSLFIFKDDSFSPEDTIFNRYKKI